MGFMENLRAFRIGADYTTAKSFAETVGIPYTSYLNYETKNCEPKYDLLCKLADFFHTTTDNLLGHKVIGYREKKEITHNVPVVPMPCIRDQHGVIKKQTVKQLCLKIHEEVIELEMAIGLDCLDKAAEEAEKSLNMFNKVRIASEAADVKTAVTTLEHAIGISFVQRNEAGISVNENNRRKGRLARNEYDALNGV